MITMKLYGDVDLFIYLSVGTSELYIISIGLKRESGCLNIVEATAIY